MVALPAVFVVALLTPPLEEGRVVALLPSERLVVARVDGPAPRVAHVALPACWDADECDAFFDLVGSLCTQEGRPVRIRWDRGGGRPRRYLGHAVGASGVMLIRISGPVP